MEITNCEKCGRELKSFYEDGNDIYYYYLFHCRFCDLFYKYVEEVVEEVVKEEWLVEDEEELEDCRDALKNANIEIVPTTKCLVHYQVIKRNGQQIEEGTLHSEIESKEDLRNQMLHYFETIRGFDRREVQVKLKLEIDEPH